MTTGEGLTVPTDEAELSKFIDHNFPLRQPGGIGETLAKLMDSGQIFEAAALAERLYAADTGQMRLDVEAAAQEAGLSESMAKDAAIDFAVSVAMDALRRGRIEGADVVALQSATD